MSITFGKTRADNFGRIFEGNPRALTRNPYLNYLRHYKSQHPRYSLLQIMCHGSREWRHLKPSQRQLFTQKNVLDSVVRPRLRPPGGRHPRRSRSVALPARRMPTAYKRRSMNAARNVRRSWRKPSKHPKYRTARKSAQINRMPFEMYEQHEYDEDSAVREEDSDGDDEFQTI